MSVPSDSLTVTWSTTPPWLVYVKTLLSVSRAQRPDSCNRLVDPLALPELLGDTVQGDPSVREHVPTVGDGRGRRERTHRDRDHGGRDDPHHHHGDRELDQREPGLSRSGSA